jgi:hypothetical protein
MGRAIGRDQRAGRGAVTSSAGEGYRARHATAACQRYRVVCPDLAVGNVRDVRKKMSDASNGQYARLDRYPGQLEEKAGD